MKKLDPNYKLRYAEGLGDVVKCFLHSRFFGPVTKLITGQDSPCNACQMRSIALNILVPLPIWRIFFKTIEDRDEIMVWDLKDYGYEVDPLEVLQKQKVPINNQESEILIENQNELDSDLEYIGLDFPLKYNNFQFSNKIESDEGDTKVVILFYKKN